MLIDQSYLVKMATLHIHLFTKLTFITVSSFLPFYGWDENKANMQNEQPWTRKDLYNGQKEKLLLWDWHRKLWAYCALG